MGNLLGRADPLPELSIDGLLLQEEAQRKQQPT